MKLRAAIHPEMHYEINLHALTSELVHVASFFYNACCFVKSYC